LNEKVDIDLKPSKKELEGFELIKQFVEQYPKTEYPTVDDDLVELFMNGARALGLNHIVCVGDKTFCPRCKEQNGLAKKKGLALDALIGNNVICHWCYVEDWQDKKWDDTETCKHSTGKGLEWDEKCKEWRKEDCLSVLEAYENSYKAILKEQGWV